MFVPGRCHVSLADLIALRTTLRQQEFVLRSALSNVQAELRSWHEHRHEHELEGKPVPRELKMVWEELAERERALAVDLLQVQTVLRETIRDVQDALRPHPRAG
jgi:hypothetical protein